MHSFRVSEHLEEMIKQECKRRNTDFQFVLMKQLRWERCAIEHIVVAM